ncbi:MAG: hypothetical protein KY395_01790 [Actinobacteria bacterium]|nr:hypothetical protein [Actinomycetota bacterium]
MKRLGSLILAVVLVLGALWIRGRTGGGLLVAGGGLDGRLTCSTELRRACEALSEDHPRLRVKVEPAGVTAEAIAARRGAAPDFDVWLTLQPYGGVARELLGATTDRPVLGTASGALAHSRIGMYVHESRAQTLSTHCQGQMAWGCVLGAISGGQTWDNIGGEETWGPIKPHIDDPAEASALLALGGAAVGLIGENPDGLTIRENADFATALSSLKRARTRSELPASAALARMLAVGPSEIDIVVALTAERDRFGDAASKARLLYPAPVVSAQVVAVPRRNAEVARDLMDALLASRFRETLESTGWDVGSPATGTQNSPSVGAHITLRDMWRELP